MGLDQKNDGKMTDGWKDEESVCAELKQAEFRREQSNPMSRQSKCQNVKAPGKNTRGNNVRRDKVVLRPSLV